MSEQVAVAIIAAFAPTILASSTLYVSIRNGKKAKQIITATTEIHQLTNSNLTRVSNELKVATTEIEGLKRMVESMTMAKGIADTVAEKLAEKV